MASAILRAELPLSAIRGLPMRSLSATLLVMTLLAWERGLHRAANAGHRDVLAHCPNALAAAAPTISISFARAVLHAGSNAGVIRCLTEPLQP
jgi:hypothetical protein